VFGLQWINLSVNNTKQCNLFKLSLQYRQIRVHILLKRCDLIFLFCVFQQFYVEHLFNLFHLMIICPKLTTGQYAKFILINLRSIAKQLITTYIIHSWPIIPIGIHLFFKRGLGREWGQNCRYIVMLSAKQGSIWY